VVVGNLPEVYELMKRVASDPSPSSV
jgi:hypothetical protein